MMSNKYEVYDSFVSMCLVEAHKRYGNKRNIIITTPLSSKKISDRMLLKILGVVHGALGYTIYLQTGFFHYWWLRLTTKTQFTRYTKRTKLEGDFVIEDKDALDFFDRPSRACEQPITIIEEVYNAYYN